LRKAVFLDRDGVINEMVYVKEHGYVDSPSTTKQFKLIKGVTKAVKILKKRGYVIIIISNQPGIAKGYFDKKTFELISKKMNKIFLNFNTAIDGEFYCFHHPNAKLKKFKKRCSCRKPGIGLVKKAAKIHEVDLKKSYVIGDGIVDMIIAKKAGCAGIFVGNVNSSITKLFDDKKAWPKYIANNLLNATNFIKWE